MGEHVLEIFLIIELYLLQFCLVLFQFWWNHLGVPYDDVFYHDLYRKWKPIALLNRASDGTKIAIQMAAQVHCITMLN